MSKRWNTLLMLAIAYSAIVLLFSRIDHSIAGFGESVFREGEMAQKN